MTTPETVNLEDAAAELIELAGVAECIDHVLQSKLRSARRGAQVALTSLNRNLLGAAEDLDQSSSDAAAELIELAFMVACIDRSLEGNDESALEDAQGAVALLERRLLALAEQLHPTA